MINNKINNHLYHKNVILYTLHSITSVSMSPNK